MYESKGSISSGLSFVPREVKTYIAFSHSDLLRYTLNMYGEKLLLPKG